MPTQESGLVTRTVPKVTGGVSQRSPVVRDPSQCTELINALPDSVLGLSRRPSSDYLCKLATFNGAHFLYTFSFSPTEKYALFIKDEALTVVDLCNKTEMAVTIAGGSEEYLDISAGSPSDLRAITVGTETFIANRGVTVLNDTSTKSAKDDPTALVWVRLGDLATNYSVVLDSVTTAACTTSTTDRADIDTTNIAVALDFAIPQGRSLSYIKPVGVFVEGDTYTVTETHTGKTSTFHVFPRLAPPGVILLDIAPQVISELFFDEGHTHGNLWDLLDAGTAEPNFTIGGRIQIWSPTKGVLREYTATTDSADGSFEVQNLGILPDTYEVAEKSSSIVIKKPDPMNPGQYIDFDIAVNDGLGGQALQVHKGSTQRFSDLPLNAVEGLKMRVTGELVSEVDDFYVKYTEVGTPQNSGVWVESLKGNELTSLNPATMPHVLTPDGAGGWNFGPATWDARAVGTLVTNKWPSFVGGTIDDMFFYKDRLGFVSGENVVMSQAGSYFNFFRKSVAQLLDEERIDVTSNSALVNKIDFATLQESELILWGDQGQVAVSGSPLLTPKTISEDPAGAYKTSRTVKPVQAGKFSYFTNERGGVTQVFEYFTVDAAKPRKEVTELTESLPKYLSGTPELIGASPEAAMIFVKLTGDSRIFVCNRGRTPVWSTWNFFGTLRAFSVIDDALILSIERSGVIFVESISLSPVPQTRHLDCVVPIATGTYATSKTTWTLPFSMPIDATYPLVVVRQDTGAVIPTGVRTIGTTIVSVSGDYHAVPVFIGLAYPVTWELSTIFVTESAYDYARGETNYTAMTDGVLQLRFIELNYGATGAFNVTVIPNTDAPAQTYTYSFVGSTDASKGTYKVPVLGQNTKVSIIVGGTSHRPFAIQNYSWTGYLSQKTKRI